MCAYCMWIAAVGWLCYNVRVVRISLVVYFIIFQHTIKHTHENEKSLHHHNITHTPPGIRLTVVSHFIYAIKILVDLVEKQHEGVSQSHRTLNQANVLLLIQISNSTCLIL